MQQELQENSRNVALILGCPTLYGARPNRGWLKPHGDEEGGMACRPSRSMYTGGSSKLNDEEGMRHRARNFDERD
jgi:hypothetical protein